MTLAGGSIRFDERDVELAFVRASGPGGQNVNKVATAVQLRYDPSRLEGVDASFLARLRTLAGRRWTRDGTILIEARRFRTQEKNRADALDRLVSLLERAAEVERPRVATRPTRASGQRRLEAKRRRSALKRDRGWSGEG